MMSRSENRTTLNLSPPDPSTARVRGNDQLHYHAQRPHLPLSRKITTKVMRPGSDPGLRCMDEDRSEETEDRALLISAITFLSMTFHKYSLAKPDSCEGLALQDHCINT